MKLSPLKITGISVLTAAVFVTGFMLMKKAKQKKGDQPPVNPQKATPSKPVPTNDSFPLTVGSKGDNVLRLQNALVDLGAKFTPTGYFGSQTKAFLESLGYSASVSQSDFDEIEGNLSGSSSGGITTGDVKIGSQAYANSDVTTWKQCSGFDTNKDVYADFKSGDYMGSFIKKDGACYRLAKNTSILGVPTGSDTFYLSIADLGKVTFK